MPAVRGKMILWRFEPEVRTGVRMAEPRTAKQVIDQAIKENRRGEWLCYGFATVFVLAGLAVIGKSLLTEQSAWSTAIGAAVSALFWPAVSAARLIRRENLAIRLLE